MHGLASDASKPLHLIADRIESATDGLFDLVEHARPEATAVAAVAAGDEFSKVVSQGVVQAEQGVVGAASPAANLHTVVASGLDVDAVDGTRHVRVGATAAAHNTDGDATVEARLEAELFERRFGAEQAACAQVSAIEEVNNTRPDTRAVPRGIAIAAVLIGLAMFRLQGIEQSCDSTIEVNHATVGVGRTLTKHPLDTLDALLARHIVHGLDGSRTTDGFSPLRTHDSFTAGQCQGTAGGAPELVGVASGAVTWHHTTGGETHLVDRWHRSQVSELTAEELVVDVVPCSDNAFVDDNVDERTNRVSEDFLQ